MTGPTGVEQVVLLDEVGSAVGEADKHAVHHAQTPLHLAFSCYVLDAAGRLLVTRRALSKATFPGVWTNTCCGHPAPGEALEDAVVRRVRQELGLSLPTSGWCCQGSATGRVMDNGVMENEMCPVFVANAARRRTADPAEVEEHRWEPWPEFRESVLAGRDVSSWCREQVGAAARGPRRRPGSLALGAPAAAR